MINNKYTIGVSVDAITHLEGNIFRLRLIPDFNSKFFIPAHTRHVLVTAELLEERFLEWINSHHDLGETAIDLGNVRGSVVQGGYYTLDKGVFQNLGYINRHIFNGEHDIFHGRRIESPYDESEIRGKRLLNVEDNTPIEISTVGCGENNTYLYGFYVGQGDMLLLITSAKNAYLIDVNLYNQNFDQKVHEIKVILRNHGMDEVRIKGLIITHKHADHIRGASELISTGVFQFENLIMNFDYIHSTSIVNKFLETAVRIPTWININKPCSIIEAHTSICFKNPDVITSLAPDINDSSIVMCVQHGGNHIYLTGDASVSVLERALTCKNLGAGDDTVLKVSHHGSRTGTNDKLIKMLTPTEAFVSAGYSRHYQHPHTECIESLKNYNVHCIISKKIECVVRYQCNGMNIIQS